MLCLQVQDRESIALLGLSSPDMLPGQYGNLPFNTNNSLLKKQADSRLKRDWVKDDWSTQDPFCCYFIVMLSHDSSKLSSSSHPWPSLFEVDQLVFQRTAVPNCAAPTRPERKWPPFLTNRLLLIIPAAHTVCTMLLHSFQTAVASQCSCFILSNSIL